MASKLKDFTVSKARPLPLLLLLDVSGSMHGYKIDSLNNAVKEMIKTFQEEDDIRAEVHITIITFGGEAKIHSQLQPAKDFSYIEMNANGNTPMGGAFQLAKEMIEDKNKIPSRAYTPTIVLVSDGQPNDNWESPLKELLNSERAKKAMRLAMAIGSDADVFMLEKFLNNPNQKVFEAQDARDIKKFFKFVTMSVTNRTRSQNPESMVIPDMDDIENIRF